MSRLRRKLGENDANPIFKTVRNGDYQFTVQVKTQTIPR